MRILAISNVSRGLAGLPFCLALVLVGLCATPPSADACDLVVTGVYVVVEDETYDCMYVSGILIIDGATLTLTGSPFANSTVTGTVVLIDGESELSFTTNHHRVSGSGGVIAGADDDAEINVASGITLTSSVTISGHLKITGAGNFTNVGLVRADSANGILSIAISGTLEDWPDSHVTRWQVSVSGAVLHFDAAIGSATGLDGRFAVSAGTLEFDEPVTSEGRLELSGGTVQVDANVTLGDPTDSEFLSFTGGTIDVAAGCTFTHH